MTKLWGILEGLNLAKLCGFKYIELHVDPMGPYTVYSLSNSMIESVGGWRVATYFLLTWNGLEC